MAEPEAEALFVPDGDRFVPTAYTRGPWDPRLQHAGPPSALLHRAIERASRLEDSHTGRFTADILRPVPIAPLVIHTRVLRPGRRVEQSEAVLALAADGTELMRATAWRLRAGAVEAPAPDAPPPPPGQGREALPGWWQDEVAYHRSLDWRLASGTIDGPGPACVWTRLRIPLVSGEAPTPTERLLVMADAASGVSWELDWGAFTFPNLDVSIHLERPPEGEWMAMDAVTRPGPLGAGQCTAVLSDATGRVGLSTQTLAIAAR